MFRWLRGARGERPQPVVSRDPVADALLVEDTLGRAPADLGEGGPATEPAPEYVPEATEAPAQAWEQEREARREQEQKGD